MKILNTERTTQQRNPVLELGESFCPRAVPHLFYLELPCCDTVPGEVLGCLPCPCPFSEVSSQTDPAGLGPAGGTELGQSSADAADCGLLFWSSTLNQYQGNFWGYQ